jgi:hypothetical protein
MKIITNTPTITTVAYTTGDAVGGVLTFSIGSEPKTCLISRIEVFEDAVTPVNGDLSLHLFLVPGLAASDNAALAFPIAHVKYGNYLNEFKLDTWETVPVTGAVGTVRRAVWDEQQTVYPLWKGTMYGQLRANAAATYATTGALSVRLWVAEYA